MPETVITVSSRHRRRRECSGPPHAIDTWPPAWRSLAIAWVRRASGSSARCKWETLLATGGAASVETAHDLLDAMLSGAWVGVDEIWRAGRWQALWIEFTALPTLRIALGMPDQDALLSALDAALANLLGNPQASAFHDAAEEAITLRPALALARIELLAALARWTPGAQSTRRDFAQFARGDTKSITSAEWDWLDARVDLANCGISGHAPLLCIVGPITLSLPRGLLNLNAVDDFVALPPATLDAATVIDSHLNLWTLVENRTSFERVARNRGIGEGVLWLPGFAPGWWQVAITRLLVLAPAPARIACDPDPAGIEIALHAGNYWHDAGLDWQPWRMSASDLWSLKQHKPMTEHDHQRVAVLRSRELPAVLGELLEAFATSGKKGEQEALL